MAVEIVFLTEIEDVNPEK